MGPGAAPRDHEGAPLFGSLPAFATHVTNEAAAWGDG